MTEIPSLAAADRNRVLQDFLRQRDQQREDSQRIRETSFDQRLRQRELIEQDVQLSARRVQDRRDAVDAQRDAQDQARDRQRTGDFIDNDNAFVERRDSIETELNSARDARDVNETLLQRDIAGERNQLAELRTLDQRNDDLRAQLIERDTRLQERRQQERIDEVRQEQALRRSISQVQETARNGPATAASELARGAIVDVSG
jgi:hypothetical protein